MDAQPAVGDQSPTLRFRSSRSFPRRRVLYAAVRDEIRDGDWLLWRPCSWAGRLICWGSRQPYSHASLAGWSRDGRLRNVEMVQWHGGRTVLLSQQLRRWPGSCDVYRPLPPYDGPGALEQMLWLCGQHYGWSDFARITCRKLLPRLALQPARNSLDPGQPRVCSASVCFAARTGGELEALRYRLDLETTPGDLASPELAKYLVTPVFPSSPSSNFHVVG